MIFVSVPLPAVIVVIVEQIVLLIILVIGVSGDSDSRDSVLKRIGVVIVDVVLHSSIYFSIIVITTLATCTQSLLSNSQAQQNDFLRPYNTQSHTKSNLFHARFHGSI